MSESFNVPSVGVVLEKIPSSAHNAICGYKRNVAMSAEDLKLTQTTSSRNAVARLDPLMADQSRK
jgi:hypothetical protein